MNHSSDQKPYPMTNTESGNAPLSESLPPIHDFGIPLAIIQIHTRQLMEHESTDWLKLPLMECFSDIPCRYTMSIGDYWQLAEELEQECKRHETDGKE